MVCKSHVLPINCVFLLPFSFDDLTKENRVPDIGKCLLNFRNAHMESGRLNKAIFGHINIGKHLLNWPTCLTASRNVWSEMFVDFSPKPCWPSPLRDFFVFFFFFESKCKNKQQIWGCDVGFYHSKRGTATTGIQIERVRDNENGWINKMRTDFWLVCFANLFSNMM